MSYPAARMLRDRVAAEDGLSLPTPWQEVMALLAPADGATEDDPELWVRGQLSHEGLRYVDGSLRLDPGYARQAAAASTAIASLVGFVGLWLYGLVVLAAGGAIFWLLGHRYGEVARRAPGWLPRGRVLGLAAAATAIVAVALLIVVPVRELRTPGMVDAWP